MADVGPTDRKSAVTFFVNAAAGSIGQASSQTGRGVSGKFEKAPAPDRDRVKVGARPVIDNLPTRVFDNGREAMPLLGQLQELFPRILIGGSFRLLQQFGAFLPVKCGSPRPDRAF